MNEDETLEKLDQLFFPGVKRIFNHVRPTLFFSLLLNIFFFFLASVSDCISWLDFVSEMKITFRESVSVVMVIAWSAGTDALPEQLNSFGIDFSRFSMPAFPRFWASKASMNSASAAGTEQGDLPGVPEVVLPAVPGGDDQEYKETDNNWKRFQTAKIEFPAICNRESLPMTDARFAERTISCWNTIQMSLLDDQPTLEQPPARQKAGGNKVNQKPEKEECLDDKLERLEDFVDRVHRIKTKFLSFLDTVEKIGQGVSSCHSALRSISALTDDQRRGFAWLRSLGNRLRSSQYYDDDDVDDDTSDSFKDASRMNTESSARNKSYARKTRALREASLQEFWPVCETILHTSLPEGPISFECFKSAAEDFWDNFSDDLFNSANKKTTPSSKNMERGKTSNHDGRKQNEDPLHQSDAENKKCKNNGSNKVSAVQSFGTCVQKLLPLLPSGGDRENAVNLHERYVDAIVQSFRMLDNFPDGELKDDVTQLMEELEKQSNYFSDYLTKIDAINEADSAKEIGSYFIAESPSGYFGPVAHSPFCVVHQGQTKNRRKRRSISQDLLLKTNQNSLVRVSDASDRRHVRHRQRRGLDVVDSYHYNKKNHLRNSVPQQQLHRGPGNRIGHKGQMPVSDDAFIDTVDSVDDDDEKRGELADNGDASAGLHSDQNIKKTGNELLLFFPLQFATVATRYEIPPTTGNGIGSVICASIQHPDPEIPLEESDLDSMNLTKAEREELQHTAEIVLQSDGLPADLYDLLAKTADERTPPAVVTRKRHLPGRGRESKKGIKHLMAAPHRRQNPGNYRKDIGLYGLEDVMNLLSNLDDDYPEGSDEDKFMEERRRAAQFFDAKLLDSAARKALMVCQAIFGPNGIPHLIFNAERGLTFFLDSNYTLSLRLEIQRYLEYVASMGLTPCSGIESNPLHALYDLLAPPLEIYSEGFVAARNSTFQDLLRYAGYGDPVDEEEILAVDEEVSCSRFQDKSSASGTESATSRKKMPRGAQQRKSNVSNYIPKNKFNKDSYTGRSKHSSSTDTSTFACGDGLPNNRRTLFSAHHHHQSRKRSGIPADDHPTKSSCNEFEIPRDYRCALDKSPIRMDHEKFRLRSMMKNDGRIIRQLSAWFSQLPRKAHRRKIGPSLENSPFLQIAKICRPFVFSNAFACLANADETASDLVGIVATKFGEHTSDFFDKNIEVVYRPREGPTKIDVDESLHALGNLKCLEQTKVSGPASARHLEAPHQHQHLARRLRRDLERRRGLVIILGQYLELSVLQQRVPRMFSGAVDLFLGNQVLASVVTFGTATTTAGGGMFGSTTSFGSPSFGAPSTSNSLFGASNPQSKPFGSSFGTPTAASGGLFGSTAQPQAGSIFGQSKPGGLFGSTTGAFGAQQGQGSYIKFEAPSTGADTMIKNGVSSQVNTRHQTITVMKEYENKSIEEIRWEDYMAGRDKGPQNRLAAGGFASPFGTTATSSAAPSLFGASTTTNTAGGLFGSQQNKPLFGSTSTTGGSLFGQQSQPAGGGLFGGQKSAFSTPTSSAGTTFGFGQTQGATTGGIFGQTQNKPAFGTGSTGIFGATTSQPSTSFGTTSFGFGSQQPAQTGFGATTSTAPTTFGFGQTSQPSAFGSTSGTMFGKPASTVAPFGATTTSSSGFGFGSGTTGFGSTTSTSGGLFGASKPAFSGFGTGTSTGTSGTGFGGFGTSTGFGTQKPGGLFGTQPSTTGLGLSTFGTSGGFGSAAPSFGTTGGGLFGSSQPQASFNVQQEQPAPSVENVLGGNPYGDSAVYKNMCQRAERKEELAKPTSLSAQRAYAKPSSSLKFKPSFDSLNGSVKPIMRRSLAISPQQASMFQGLDSEMETSTRDVTMQSARKSIKSFRPVDFKKLPSDLNASMPSPGKAKWGQDVSSPSKLILRRNVESEHLGSTPVSFGRNSSPKVIGPQDGNTDQRNESLMLPDTTTSFIQENSADKSNDSVEPVMEENKYPAGIRCCRIGYYTIPGPDELEKLVQPDGSCTVDGFTIGRTGYGSVHFPGKMDVSGLDIDEIVHIRRKEIVVYPDDNMKPPLNQGLNRHAEVTLEGCWPVARGGEVVRSRKRLDDMGYARLLEKSCGKMGATFKEYRYENGSWVFHVRHFSKYGLEEEDEDECMILEDPSRANAVLLLKPVQPKTLLNPPESMETLTATENMANLSGMENMLLGKESAGVLENGNGFQDHLNGIVGDEIIMEDAGIEDTFDGIDFSSMKHRVFSRTPDVAFRMVRWVYKANKLMWSGVREAEARGKKLDVSALNLFSPRAQQALLPKRPSLGWFTDSSFGIPVNGSQNLQNQYPLKRPSLGLFAGARETSLFNDHENAFEEEDLDEMMPRGSSTFIERPSLVRKTALGATIATPPILPSNISSPIQGTSEDVALVSSPFQKEDLLRILSTSAVTADHRFDGILRPSLVRKTALGATIATPPILPSNISSPIQGTSEDVALVSSPFQKEDLLRILSTSAVTADHRFDGILVESHGPRDDDELPSVSGRNSAGYLVVHAAPKSDLDVVGNMGRSIPLCWGRGGLIVHCGVASACRGEDLSTTGFPLGNVQQLAAIRGPGTVFFERVGMASSDMLFSNIKLQHVIHESALEIQLQHADVDDSGGEYPRIEAKRGSDCIQNQAEAVAALLAELKKDAVEDEQVKESKIVWDLMVALWGLDSKDRLSQQKDAYDHVTNVFRKKALTSWLKNMGYKSPFVMKIGDDSPVTSFDNVVQHRLRDAVKACNQLGDFNLGQLIAMGSAPKAKSMLKQQLETWTAVHLDEKINEIRLKIYCILSGLPKWLTSDGKLINPAEGLDWRRAFALHLYFSSLVSPIAEAVKSFEASFKTDEIGGPISPYPSPPYASGNNGPMDLTFHLLKLYMNRLYALEPMMDPACFCSDPLDYRMTWLVMVSLSGLGIRRVHPNVAANVIRNYAAQLETIALWEWAIFVLLHLQDSDERRRCCTGVIERNVKLNSDLDEFSKSEATRKERFVCEKLLVPYKVIASVKAAKARCLGKQLEEVEHLIDAEEFVEAHNLLITRVAPDLVMKDDWDTLNQLFSRLNAPDRIAVIQDWQTGGNVYLDFIALKNKIQISDSELSSPEFRLSQLRGLTKNIDEMKCTSSIQSVAKSIILKKLCVIGASILDDLKKVRNFQDPTIAPSLPLSGMSMLRTREGLDELLVQFYCVEDTVVSEPES
ncbi:unnamed protein product [Notodromas monacha]|uniref:Nuclear pore complex protein Nup98-Nup96 n=1 Tax=Notodromas monacha TaxID=399045 RepID=A0A7R9BLJ9_9CRUS|nr:unnamed protein product [Notodromas monacha]CAG0916911.1 unnamed protein product [Notodromas monacha]